ncbi:hypothetical protein BDV97DRAFT_147994 [Delphinella strobiligena]|nr:hypothetical protein BDV97DRAFT_147994 [Delphinella strobiligena]
MSKRIDVENAHYGIVRWTSEVFGFPDFPGQIFTGWRVSCDPCCDSVNKMDLHLRALQVLPASPQPKFECRFNCVSKVSLTGNKDCKFTSSSSKEVTRPSESLHSSCKTPSSRPLVSTSESNCAPQSSPSREIHVPQEPRNDSKKRKYPDATDKGSKSQKAQKSKTQVNVPVATFIRTLLKNAVSISKPKFDHDSMDLMSVESLLSRPAMDTAQMSDLLSGLAKQTSMAKSTTTWLNWLYDFLYGCLLLLSPNLNQEAKDRDGPDSTGATKRRAAKTIELAAGLSQIVGSNYLSIFHILAKSRCRTILASSEFGYGQQMSLLIAELSNKGFLCETSTCERVGMCDPTVILAKLVQGR